MARGKQNKYIVNSAHPEDLASGRVVEPGESINQGDLNLDDESSGHDQSLIDEGKLTLVESGPTPTESRPTAEAEGNDTGGDS